MPYIGGYCKSHHEEETAKEQRRQNAITALNRSTVDGELIQNTDLRDELRKAQRWWDRACNTINLQRRDEVLLDEAEYALEWCIIIAQGIVDSEIAFRNGRKPSGSYTQNVRWAWERFENLEKGLMSNGIGRTVK